MNRLPAVAARLAGASIAPFVTLAAPFVIFLRHYQYGFVRAEAAIVFAIFAGVALLGAVCMQLSRKVEPAVLAACLTFVAEFEIGDLGLKRLFLCFVACVVVLWVIRRHAATIVSLMMGTVIAATLLPVPDAATATATMPPRSQADLPFTIHVVLDEYMGVEGFPADITPPAFKRSVKSFFIDRGFRVFGRAYSEHPATLPSLSHLLNFASGSYESGLTVPGRRPGTYRLLRNAYFAHLERRGYSIRVYQPDYLNICAPEVAILSCTTYDPTALRTLDTLPASPLEKLSVVGGTFLVRSEVFGRLKYLYRRSRRRLADSNVRLPRWNWGRTLVSPIAAMLTIKNVIADLANAKRGDFVFVHLLIPHYPYVYDEACVPRAPSKWLMRSDPDDVDLAEGTTNTREGRAARYAMYVQQVRCVHRQIDELFAAIPAGLRNDAIIILQGDHGSRIGLVNPSGGSKTAFSRNDYPDYYSTLFAVRSPQVEPGYDVRFASINCLLRSLANTQFTSVAGADACSASKIVYFHNRTPHVFPELPISSE